MQIFLEILRSIILLAAVIGLYVLISRKLGPFVRDYRFHREGIDVVLLGGRITLFRIKKEDIREIAIMPGFRARLRSPLAHNMGNRFAKKVMLVITTKRSYMFTPADPEAALRVLGFQARRTSD